MERKEMRRVVASALATVLIAPSFGSMAVAYAKEAKNPVNQETQMSSDKEVVYVNTYSDTTVREQNFDDNWKFYLGDANGAESKNFDDSRWRNVNLPHDYSIEQEFSQSMEAESGYLPGGTGWYRKHFIVSEDMRGKELRIDFGGVYMNSTVWVNGTQLGTHPFGYTPFSFDITDLVEYGKENVITVKVDHKTPSSRWYSGSGIYRSVNLSVMDKVHVDLYGTKIETPNLKTEKGGTVNMSVKTTVANEGEGAANVVLTHTIYKKGTEDSIGTVTTDATSIAAGQSADIAATLPAENPALWGLKNPNLYTVKTEVKVGDTVVDTYETEYGFRYTEQDANTGFSLNGEKMKLKGVCMHHDQGALGAEANRRAIERQVEILQEMGVNSIRVTHNPAADELIEICNEKGMLVIDEAFDGWMYSKNGNSQDYAKWFAKPVEEGNQIIGGDVEAFDASSSDDILGNVTGLSWAQFDLTSMIKRGQNAPSIIMWSLGNEVWEGAGHDGEFPKVAQTLIDWAKQLDSSRPATIGDNKLKASHNSSWAMATSLQNAGGVIGANYCNDSQYATVHNKYPNTMLYGSETASAINSRGVYYKAGGDQSNQDLTSYDKKAVGWGAVASSAWYDIITRDYMAGEYVWTGFDYIGEPTPWNGTDGGAKGTWPSPKNSFFGIVDTAGLPKDSYYFYQSQWNEDVNTLHVLPAWNEDVVVKQGDVPVVVYSDAASVELFLTPKGSDEKKSLGKKTFTEKTTDAGYKYQVYEGEGKSNTAHENLYLTWNVPYEDGTITAVAYDKNGDKITETEGRSFVTTTGDEKKLQAEADRKEITADGKDLAYIQVDVTDKDGNIVPDAKNRVTFDVEGDGVLVGVDNGWQTDHDSYQADNRRAYNGSLVAIVQSTKQGGEFTVTAKSEGLESDSVTVKTKAVDAGEETEKKVDSFYMSKMYYVKKGSEVALPETIETRYTDGTSEQLPVVWEEKEMPTEGTFGVSGTVNDLYSVSVVVTVIDQLGGLLNYSTTTPVGVTPTLPDARQAVAADGTIMDASFPVAWNPVAENSYDKEGEVTVKGAATVLGEVLPVTATVRVQNEQIKIEGSIDKYLNLTQDIPAESQSDTLTAIWDGKTEIGANTGGGANPTAWTNYKYSQEGHNQAEITFEYATQQRLGEIVIHFFEDSASARYPDAGKTEIYVSDTGAEDSWTKLNTTETIGEAKEKVKAYTYKFSPVTATFVKFKFTNAEQLTRTDVKPCTGITEIEIKKAVGSFTTHATAEFETLTVNGVDLTEEEMAAGRYYTEEETVFVEAVGKDNASVTVLPQKDSEVKIIIESEDHKTRKAFIVKAGQTPPLAADDGSKDYPIAKLTATAGSEQANNATEGLASYAIDNKMNTLFHTSWNPKATEDQLWYQLEMQEVTEIEGLRYMPRQGGNNGSVTKYQVLYKVNESDEWQEAVTGDWDTTKVWKIAQFEQPVEAKFVKLVAVDSIGDSSGRHMSAAEIRIRTTEVTEHSETEQPLEPGDASRDVPVADMTLTAGTSQSGNEVDKAKDNNTKTWWHTSWSSPTTSTDLWIMAELKTATELEALRYYPRYQGTNHNQGHQNGFIRKYRVEVSQDKQTWETVAEGTWEPADTWLIAPFAKKVTVKYVKLVGLETLANNNPTNDSMSVAELRLRKASEPVPEKTELQKLIEKAKKYSAAAYTEDSFKALQAAITEAESAADEQATLTKLQAAIDGLVNVAALKAKEAEVKAIDLTLCTADSRQAVTDALSGLEALYKSGTKETIQAKIETLDAAKDQLVQKQVGLAEYQEEMGEKLPEKDYEAESYQAYSDAYDALKALDSKDENLSMSEFNAAKETYENAKRALVSIKEDVTVTFDMDGKTTNVKFVKGETIGDKLPKAPNKDGYTFQGWYTEAEGNGEEVTANTVVTENMTVYAYYTENEVPPVEEKVTVTFSVDGETTTAQVVKGEKIGDKLPDDPAKEGYTFKGWNTKADGTGKAVTADTVVDADMTVYAVFEENEVEPPAEEKVTVTFSIDGETTTAQVVKGEKIGDKLPDDPAKEGYTFKGWNTKADGTGKAVTVDTVVDADMTVYAVFEEDKAEPPVEEKVTVTFSVDGETTTAQVVKGEKIGDNLPKAPTKDGYTFEGWNTKADGTGVIVTADTEVNADMTVYAVFVEDGEEPPVGKVTITFDVDGETTSREVIKGEKVGELPKDPVKAGYTFKGWNTKADGTGTAVTADTVANTDMTVYAVFEKNAVPKPPVDVNEETAQKYYDECLVYYAEENYTADSWKVYAGAMSALKAALADGNVSKEELQAAIDAVAEAAGELKVEEKEEMTVTFSIDGKITTVKVVKGEKINDKLPGTPAKDGYTFKGWNTKADGTGKAVTADTVVDADMTVYAVFEKNPDPKPPVPVDKDAAQKYYNECLAYYVKGDYTAESWKVYENAMNALKAALADGNISKEELQAAVDAVAKAAEGLKKVDAATPDKDAGTPDKDSGKTEEGVKTGDSISTGAVVGIIVAAVAAAGAIVWVVLSKKKKK